MILIFSLVLTWKILCQKVWLVQQAVVFLNNNSMLSNTVIDSSIHMTVNQILTV